MWPLKSVAIIFQTIGGVNDEVSVIVLARVKKLEIKRQLRVIRVNVTMLIAFRGLLNLCAV